MRWIIYPILAVSLVACQNWREEKYPAALKPEDLAEVKRVPVNYQPPQRKKYVKSRLSEGRPTEAMKKPVSLTLTEALPVKEALFELSRQAGVDLQLDPKIEAKLTFSAKQRPFIEVVGHLCELAGLRYRIIGNAVRIEMDTPVTRNYNLQFLNSTRATQNRVSIATDVFSANTTQTGTPKNADNGSNSAVSVTSNNDFWQELENNLATILGSANYAIHRQGGLITVVATEQQHRLLENYLDQLRRVVSSQVLIEAKVIEVTLHDEYRSGINWQKLVHGDVFVNMPLGQMAQQGRLTTPQAAQGDVLAFGFKGRNFSAILQAIEQFGASQTLSSPRLTVMNNQTAILKVAQNQVYFRLNYDKQLYLNVNREGITVSSDIQTVPIGLVMSVQPSIDEETGHITLSLRPTISRLTHTVRDPAVDIALANSRGNNPEFQGKPSLIPVVEVREIDSVLRLKSGEIGVLGGLMEIRSTNEQSQLPVAGDIPVVGELFSSHAVGDQVIELVILLRATIVDSEGIVPDAADQRLYENYMEDPRPLGDKHVA